MSDDIVTRLRVHYFKQQKLDPPMRPFVQVLNWRSWGIRIGRHEFAIKKKANRG